MTFQSNSQAGGVLNVQMRQKSAKESSSLYETQQLSKYVKEIDMSALKNKYKRASTVEKKKVKQQKANSHITSASKLPEMQLSPDNPLQQTGLQSPGSGGNDQKVYPFGYTGEFELNTSALDRTISFSQLHNSLMDEEISKVNDR